MDTLNRASDNKKVGGIFETYGMKNGIVHFRYNEMLNIIDNSLTSKWQHKELNEPLNAYETVLFCVLCMIFGQRQDDEVIKLLFNDNTLKPEYVFPNNLDRAKACDKMRLYLNGLHLNFIEQCHVISHIQYADKNILLTHGGMINELTYPIMMNSKETKSKTGLRTIISSINGEVSGLIAEMKDPLKPANKIALKQLAHKFIFMTAPCNHEATHITASHAPVVTKGLAHVLEYPNEKMEPPPEAVRFMLSDVPAPAPAPASSLQLEGGWQDYDGTVQFATNNAEGSTLIDYNIFGHLPQGMVPKVYTVRSDTNEKLTTHICLDISKAEQVDVASNDSYAMFMLSSAGEAMLGKFKVYGSREIEAKTAKSNQKLLTPIVDSIDVFYNLPLDEYVEERTVSGTPDKMQKITDSVSVKTVGREVRIHVASAAIGGGRAVAYKNTQTKVAVGKREYVLYKAGNAKFIKSKGAYVKLADAKKRASA